MNDETPNGDGADLGTKIEDYVLNLRHWDGRHRARGFESALGITLANRRSCLRIPFEDGRGWQRNL